MNAERQRLVDKLANGLLRYRDFHGLSDRKLAVHFYDPRSSFSSRVHHKLKVWSDLSACADVGLLDDALRQTGLYETFHSVRLEKGIAHTISQDSSTNIENMENAPTYSEESIKEVSEDNLSAIPSFNDDDSIDDKDYGLDVTESSTILEFVKEHNDSVTRTMLERLASMNHREFEFLVARLLSKMGLKDAVTTPQSKDGGVDARGTMKVLGESIGFKVSVQAKRYALHNKVGRPAIQQLRGTLEPNETGLFVTTSYFTQEAQIEASAQNKTPINLIDGETFVKLLIEHEIGVQYASVKLLHFTGSFSS